MEVIIMIGITVAFVAIIFLALAVKVVFKKNGEFPEHRVGHNSLMRKRKIYCVKTQDVVERKNYMKKLRIAAEEKRLIMMDIPLDEDDLPTKTNFKNLRLAES